MLLSPRRLCPGPPDRHGSALVLIIVTLMLLLILGAAYLQTARSDRMAFAPGPAEDAALSDKATAIIAIEDLLKKTLLDDLTNDNNSSLLSVADDDEIYDYPWTNGSASRTVFREAAPTTPVSSDGGTLDDTWLASTVPDISGPQPVWQHLTSLTGLYLRIPKAGNPSGYLTPWDDPGDDGENIIDNATASEWTWHDTDVAMLGADSLATSWTNWEPLGVDADQDGFPDSRWEWAPKRQINNTIFIMAVRIVDNSSMLNVNTMGAVTDGTNYSGDPVRGYFPSSLDASRLMSISKNGGGANSNWATELRASFYDRLGSTPSLPMPVGVTAPLPTWSAATNSLAELWLAAPTYDSDDETELRRRGGVNDESATLPIEVALGNLVDSSRTGDAAGYPQLGGSPTTAQAQAFFIGGPYSTSIESRDHEHTRHLLTTHSGASMLTEEHGANGNFQYDTHSVDVNSLASLIKAVLSSGSNYNGLSGGPMDALAMELALNIVDYSDSDNTPTSGSANGYTLYGLEMLPILREVYAHGRYTASGGNWVKQGQHKSRAAALDVGNMFDRDMTSDMLDGNIRLQVLQGGSVKFTDIWGDSDGNPFKYALPTGTVIPAGGSMAVWYAPEKKSGFGEGGMGGVFPDHFNIPAGVTTWQAGKLDNPNKWDVDNAQLEFELAFKDGNQNWVVYDKLTDPLLEFVSPTPGSSVSGKKYRQVAVYRDGRYLRYLSNQGVTAAERRPGDNGGFQTNVDQMGEDTKTIYPSAGTVTGDSNLDFQVIPWANHPMFSSTEVGFIPMIGITSTPPICERVAGLSMANRLFLDSSNSAVLGGGGVPHLSVLIDALAAAGTLYDGIDNDGDGTVDENSEWVMRGSMNINTAPRFLLALSMTSPESFSDIKAMVDSIIAYRKGTSRQLPAGGRTNPGIAYTGELLYMNPGGGSSATDMKRYSGSSSLPPQVDLIPHPDDPDYGTQVDETQTHGFEPEARLARLQLLTQAYRPRSDIYTAYVIMRAYSEQAGAFDFTSTFTETRLIYQLNRTTVSQSGGAVTCTELYREGD